MVGMYVRSCKITCLVAPPPQPRVKICVKKQVYTHIPMHIYIYNYIRIHKTYIYIWDKTWRIIHDMGWITWQHDMGVSTKVCMPSADVCVCLCFGPNIANLMMPWFLDLTHVTTCSKKWIVHTTILSANIHTIMTKACSTVCTCLLLYVFIWHHVR